MNMNDMNEPKKLSEDYRGLDASEIVQMDCPTPTSVNRWYRDGYMARLNGKLRSTNPKGSNVQKFSGSYWSCKKAQRWDDGWIMADTAVHRMAEWDREQEIIDELGEEFSL